MWRAPKGGRPTPLNLRARFLSPLVFFYLSKAPEGKTQQKQDDDDDDDPEDKKKPTAEV